MKIITVHWFFNFLETCNNHRWMKLADVISPVKFFYDTKVIAGYYQSDSRLSLNQLLSYVKLM